MQETSVLHDFIITNQQVLSKWSRYWFAEIFFSALTACGTVSSWILNSDNPKRYKKFYYFLQRLGEQNVAIQIANVAWLLGALHKDLQQATSVRFALDDSPIKRSGPKIEGAGLMHDPTNATNKNAICYGHSLVMLSLIVDHPKWGTTSLPFLWSFYVRKDDLPQIDEALRPEFQTKLQIGIDLVTHAAAIIRKTLDKPIHLTFDRGYVSKDLFEAMDQLDVDVITRFKYNANFYELPEKPTTPKRGRPRKFGNAFKLEDWLANNDSETVREEIMLYGGLKCVEFKTMIATSRITNGRPVRLVASRLVTDGKASSWGVFVSTNLSATPQEILSEYSRRFSIEEMFKDMKEVCGLGRQETRKWQSCVACTTITALKFAVVEMLTWDEDASELTSSRSPWDNPNRRPSHRNKRDFVARKIGFEIFSRIIPEAKNGVLREKILWLARFLGMGT